MANKDKIEQAIKKMQGYVRCEGIDREHDLCEKCDHFKFHEHGKNCNAFCGEEYLGCR
jgi:hypothetical protein